MRDTGQLEANLQRVVDQVLRTMAAADDDEPRDPDPGRQGVLDGEVADLCGHVAVALSRLGASGMGLATYRPPAVPVRPALDVLR